MFIEFLIGISLFLNVINFAHIQELNQNGYIEESPSACASEAGE